MSAAVANKEDKKPLYKDYVSFLGSYRQGKKDEEGDKEERYSPSISSNNSSASELSDLPRRSFKEYLENYNNKKFNSVQADFKKNPSQSVKTEVFIEINNDVNATRLISKTIELNIEPHTEKREQKVAMPNDSDKSVIESQEKIATPVLQFKTTAELGQRKIHLEEPSQMTMENSVQASNEVKKRPLKKTPSITEKTKMFEKICTKNKTSCRIEAAPANNGCLPPKPVLHKVTSLETPEKESFVKPKLAQKGAAFALTASIVSTQANHSQPEIVLPKPVLHKGISESLKKETCIKPKLAKKSVDLSTAPTADTQHNHSHPTIALPEKSTNDSAPSTATPIPGGIPPPPPPPPVGNFSPKKLSFSPKPNPSKMYSTMPKLQSTKQADTLDGNAPPVLDKHDPRVKKMVYGALRGMYGAYHDKANDYLATLPKNRVKKNNGLDSIINSIASQGGLEKLTGRGNPKTEAE